MIPVIRRPISTHDLNYGSVNANIDALTGQTDGQQESYLELANTVFPSIPGATPWVRVSRRGIDVTAAYPDWSASAARYWPNMFTRPDVSNFMRNRRLILDPDLYVRTASGPFRTTPCAAPDYFGRNSDGANTVADGSNSWRTDIRTNLDRLLTADVGTTGGEPYITRAKATNYKVTIALGPNEIDLWENARNYYVADAEV